MSSFTLSGRRAIVTGSTSGIGQGIANMLAAAGCAVMLNGFGDADAIEQQRSMMAKQYGVVLYDKADLAKAEDCEQLVRNTEQRFGDVDILVNNAGIQCVAPVEEFPRERWTQFSLLISLQRSIPSALLCPA